MTRQVAATIAVIDIGGTWVRVGFADRGRPVNFARTYPTSEIRQGALVPRLASLLRMACKEAGLDPSRVVASIPGFIDRDFDRVLHAANIPELSGILLASELSLELGLPVRLERDVVLQLLGESVAGAVVHERDVLAVYFGTGIGAAYLAESGIFRGGGWALELGHMPVYSPHSGDSSPKRIEAYAAGATLVELAAEHGTGVGELFSSSDNSPRLREALDDVVWHQAVAVASASCLFSPRTILLGGGVVEMDRYPGETLKRRIIECLPHLDLIQPFDIRWARLGWQAAIYGAVLFASEADVVSTVSPMRT